MDLPDLDNSGCERHILQGERSSELRSVMFPSGGECSIAFSAPSWLNFAAAGARLPAHTSSWTSEAYSGNKGIHTVQSAQINNRTGCDVRVLRLATATPIAALRTVGPRAKRSQKARTIKVPESSITVEGLHADWLWQAAGAGPRVAAAGRAAPQAPARPRSRTSFANTRAWETTTRLHYYLRPQKSAWWRLHVDESSRGGVGPHNGDVLGGAAGSNINAEYVKML